MGKTITHVGPIGAGQAVKAVNQVILAGTYLGVAEGIVLAIKAGLDVEQVVGALGGGAAQSWVLANRSGRMIENDYPLGFKVALHRKDLGDRARARRRDRRRPAGQPARARELETGLVAEGHGDDDMSAVARSIRASGSRPAAADRRRLRSDDARAGVPSSSIGSPSLPVVARPEPLDVVDPGDVDRARAERPGRAASCGRTCRPGSRPSGRARRRR